MSIINATVATFESEVLESNVPVLVDFWAEWCGPCKAVTPVLEELAQAHEEALKIVKIDIDNERELAQAFQVKSIPTLMIIHNKEVKDHMVGFPGAGPLKERVAKLLG